MNTDDKTQKIPEEAIKGLISAMEDVKNGRYTILTKDKKSIPNKQK